MKIKLDSDKLETMQKTQETVMANARVNKEDWEQVRKVLKAKGITWSSIIREVIRQIIKK